MRYKTARLKEACKHYASVHKAEKEINSNSLEKSIGIISCQNLGDSFPQVISPVILFSVWRASCPGIFQIQFQGSRFNRRSLEFSGILGAASDFLPESFKRFCDYFGFSLLFYWTEFPVFSSHYFFLVT